MNKLLVVVVLISGVFLFTTDAIAGPFDPGHCCFTTSRYGREPGARPQDGCVTEISCQDIVKKGLYARCYGTEPSSKLCQKYGRGDPVTWTAIVDPGVKNFSDNQTASAGSNAGWFCDTDTTSQLTILYTVNPSEEVDVRNLLNYCTDPTYNKSKEIDYVVWLLLRIYSETGKKTASWDSGKDAVVFQNELGEGRATWVQDRIRVKK